MRNWTDAQLESLYDITAEKPGWLSKLQSNMNVSEEDTHYLEWLDNHERDGQKQAAKIIPDPEESTAFQLLRVNDQIRAIEKESVARHGDERFLFLGLSDLDDLMAERWKLRNALLSKCLPDRELRISDDAIERARAVPLYAVIANLPRNRFILCPSHKESTPSFKVFERGYCFGCGVVIDSISWVMQFENLSFVDAVKRLNR